MQKGKPKAKGKAKGAKPKNGAAKGKGEEKKPEKGKDASQKPKNPDHDPEAKNGHTLVRCLGPGAGKVPANQNYPPTRTVYELYPNQDYPPGEECPYLNE